MFILKYFVCRSVVALYWCLIVCKDWRLGHLALKYDCVKTCSIIDIQLQVKQCLLSNRGRVGATCLQLSGRSQNSNSSVEKWAGGGGGVSSAANSGADLLFRRGVNTYRHAFFYTCRCLLRLKLLFFNIPQKLKIEKGYTEWVICFKLSLLCFYENCHQIFCNKKKGSQNKCRAGYPYCVRWANKGH